MAAVDLDAALSADSSVSASASLSWALAAAPSADSTLTPPLLSVALSLGSTLQADSDVLADLLNVVPLEADLQADSAFAAETPDIYRLPPPNRPQPLPVPATAPLRIVPNPPRDPEMSVGSPAASPRRRGL